ncbi:sigma factor-like helix-turn-helix DNA-binding protein [Actinoplanes sp. NPDC048967]|uniref:sigma factor-like helix-turn-helix DNA-binding protein n=1 Tax=Actinoplanes sp. NPDC048967 TaxID=3155269 RepID=UPI0033C21962
MLRYWEDLSVESVAEILGLPTGTVTSQSARSLARLRHLLGQPAGVGARKLVVRLNSAEPDRDRGPGRRTGQLGRERLRSAGRIRRAGPGPPRSGREDDRRGIPADGLES